MSHGPSPRPPLLAWSLGLLLLTACAKPASLPEPRFVLLYATCSLNKDFLGPYDPSVSYTPSITRLARRGLVFRKHHTEAGQSGVAYASLFTGAQAQHHGVYAHPTPLAPENLLITEAYAQAGYDVHAWLAHGLADAGLGYAQGVAPANVHHGLLRGRNRDFARILQRLERDPEYRVFVIVNFTVTHAPYDVRPVERFCREHPQECPVRADTGAFEALAELYRSHHAALSLDFEPTVAKLGLSEPRAARLRDVIGLLYKANVARLDRLFGGILSRLRRHGLLQESLIAFTADHGETQFRENTDLHWTHGLQLAPEVLNVPWLLYGPTVGVKPGAYDGVTRSIDVFPTLAGLSDVALPDFPGRGVDLSAAVRGLEEPADLRAFSHTALFSFASWEFYRRSERIRRLYPRREPEMMWVAVREGDELHKLIRRSPDHWERVAFDLSTDAGEESDLYDPANERHQEIGRALRAYKRSLLADLATRSDPMRSRLSPQAIEALKALGYAE